MLPMRQQALQLSGILVSRNILISLNIRTTRNWKRVSCQRDQPLYTGNAALREALQLLEYLHSLIYLNIRTTGTEACHAEDQPLYNRNAALPTEALQLLEMLVRSRSNGFPGGRKGT
ncbi:hypothetical protein AVEN_194932-1 [Araneus ventricosus]|uniref:Uncharacterized protein n=1 Tax=Araneus ventricosus TaxID=182803 RepID=A0A4Y2UA18_ARAVE|nr:hypothetical protein AVEN_194932-1 [Araneus ventricosus]